MFANMQRIATPSANRSPFGTTFDPRYANVCLEYTTDVTGSLTTIANGCANSTGSSAGLGGQGGAVPLIDTSVRAGLPTAVDSLDHSDPSRSAANCRNRESWPRL